MREFDEVAAEIVRRVLKDLRGRRGLRQQLDQIQDVAPDILRLRDDLEYEGDLVDDLRGVVLGVLDGGSGEAPAEPWGVGPLGVTGDIPEDRPAPAGLTPEQFIAAKDSAVKLLWDKRGMLPEQSEEIVEDVLRAALRVP